MLAPVMCSVLIDTPSAMGAGVVQQHSSAIGAVADKSSADDALGVADADASVDVSSVITQYLGAPSTGAGAGQAAKWQQVRRRAWRWGTVRRQGAAAAPHGTPTHLLPHPHTNTTGRPGSGAHPAAVQPQQQHERQQQQQREHQQQQLAPSPAAPALLRRAAAVTSRRRRPARQLRRQRSRALARGRVRAPPAAAAAARVA
jgi:hypothetical protein